jgi:hypothetical protein
MNITEVQLVEAIRNNQNKIKIIEHEFRLLSAHNIFLSMLDDSEKPPVRTVGVMDLIFKFKNKIYGCEIKSIYPTKQDAFWHSLKIIGYCSYYKFQTGNSLNPAIMIPFETITLEIQYVCSDLKVKLFGYFEKDNEIHIQEISDKPIWHQSKK